MGTKTRTANLDASGYRVCRGPARLQDARHDHDHDHDDKTTPAPASTAAGHCSQGGWVVLTGPDGDCLEGDQTNEPTADNRQRQRRPKHDNPVEPTYTLHIPFIRPL